MPTFPIKLQSAAAAAALGLFSLAPVAAFADNSISTGSTDTSVSITNELNSNVADVSGSGGGSASVNIFGNGARSHNAVFVSNRNATVVNQSNFANVLNRVNVHSNTGENSVSSNTDSLAHSELLGFCLVHPWMSFCH